MKSLSAHIMILFLIGGGQTLQCLTCVERRLPDYWPCRHEMKTCDYTEDVCVTYTTAYTLVERGTGSGPRNATHYRCGTEADLACPDCSFCREIKSDLMNMLAKNMAPHFYRVENHTCHLVSYSRQDHAGTDWAFAATTDGPMRFFSYFNAGQAPQVKLIMAAATLVVYALF